MTWVDWAIQNPGYATIVGVSVAFAIANGLEAIGLAIGGHHRKSGGVK